MKHILMSVTPEWLEKILNKEKTIEVRTTCPTEWKKYLIDSLINKMFSKGYSKPDDYVVYLYCTKDRNNVLVVTETKAFIHKTTNIDNVHLFGNGYIGNGKVVCKFTLRNIEEFELWSDLWKFSDEIQDKIQRIQKQSCVPHERLANYLGKKTGYGWHIDDLKIYDKPKELSEFRVPECEKPETACGNCKYLEVINTPTYYECECIRPNTIIRPPQSWCYVEVTQDNL